MDHPLYRDGEVISVDPVAGTRKVYRDIDEKHGVILTERLSDEALLRMNAEERSETAGQQFGDFRKVASIPEALAMQELMPAIQNYDDEYIKRWLNDFDHSKFRTFEGKV